MKKLAALVTVILFTISVRSQVLISLLLGDFLNIGKIEFVLDSGLLDFFIPNFVN